MTHDELYRDLRPLRKLRVTVCGCGAIGSRVALELSRLHVPLELVDFDAVDEHNIFNQVYSLRDVGAKKVNALANLISVSTRQTPLKSIARISAQNVRRLTGGVLVDCFDNIPSRSVLRDYGLHTDTPVLHAGVSADIGEVVWNHADYLRGTAQEDVCDVPMALPTIIITSGIVIETLVHFSFGRKRNTRFYLPLMEMIHDTAI